MWDNRVGPAGLFVYADATQLGIMTG